MIIKGSSAAAFIDTDETDFIAVSDYTFTMSPNGRDRESNFVPKTKLLISENPADQENSIEYLNKGLSQGLTCVKLDGKCYLLEAENTIFRNSVIYLIDLQKLLTCENVKEPQICTLNAPHTYIEDLAWDPEGEAVWVSDEDSFRFYRGKFAYGDECDSQ